MNELLEVLSRATHLALLLDFDGTLAEIVPRPVDARPLPEALVALERLVRLPGVEVAVISGRALEDLVSRLPLPGAWIAGSHGAELRAKDGAREALVPFARARPAITSFLAQAQATVGRLDAAVEDKGAAAAAHFRTLPRELVPARSAALQAHALAVTGEGTARALEGKEVLEVRASGVDKAHAARRLLDRLGATTPVAVGDDATDEDMLRESLARGGLAVRVGPGPSVATRRLADPAEVARFLGELVRART